MEQIEIFKGDDLTLPFTITTVDADGIERVMPINGFTCFFTAKKNALDADADAYIKETWTDHSNPTNGITELILPGSELSVLGSYTFDFGYVTTDNKKQTLVVGKLNIVQQVTQTV